MRSLLAVVALAFITLPAGMPVSAVSRETPDGETRPIDLVICLDTSGSMQDLINSARGRIWDIVNKLAKASPTPRLRVGLLSYGSPNGSTAEQGWIVLQTDLTDDLDALYAKLMALTTDGGDEFVGWVIGDAVQRMSWSADTDALRLVYVAGNESADQAVEQRNFRYVAEQASEKDIIINSIYGGSREQGIQEQWDLLAQHGSGAYFAIDMESGTVQIATPFDSTLELLNDELNGTYIPYGEEGPDALANVLAQDINARLLGSQSCGSRIAAKGCAIYTTASWDLVDAVGQEGFLLADVSPADLAEPLRSMTLEERRRYIKGMTAVRDAVQSEIQDVNANREAFLAAERRITSTGRLGLDDAMLQSLHAQAEAKGFSFPEERTVVRSSPPELEEREPPFGPLIQGNVDALIAAMPALRFGIGTYTTKHREFASILAEHIDGEIRFVVGERLFDSRSDATEHLVRELEREAEALQTVQVVTVVTASPFPYAANQAGGPQLSPGKARYRIGGFEFADEGTADQVAERIANAVSPLKRKHTDRKTADVGSGRVISAIMILDVGPDARNDSTAETVKDLESMIRTIAQTAGRAFQDLVQGC
jgi:hypothetical protein